MDFALTCTDNGPGLPLELSLHTPFTKEQVHNSLLQASWTNLKHDQDTPCHRYFCNTTSCTKLQSILDYISSDLVKQTLAKCIALGHLDATFHEINDYGKMHVALVKDQPGYSVGRHYDPKHVWMSGMIYLNMTPDINRATEFYTNQHDILPFYTSNTNFSKGWAIFNNTWHAGKNGTEKNRYSILFFLFDKRQEKNTMTGAHK